MSTAAQEEFDRLFNYKEKVRGHPEDGDNSDNESSPHSDDDDQNNNYAHSDDNSDDDDYTYHTRSNKMVSRTAYTVPSTVFEANTGPKGVIADAQSFERARKRSFRRTLLSVAGLDSYSKKADSRPHKDSNDNDVDEEEFMRRWRETRLQELQQRSQRRPGKRVYGRVDTVDGPGYVNAIERAPSDTVVVVCIYDPEVCADMPVAKAIDANCLAVRPQRPGRGVPAGDCAEADDDAVHQAAP